ncbi:MAG: methionine adenosyltransferase [Bdellovibrionales bacterium RIFOXYB1_FULL_37_110]|nr:MAG: methionine adenosyltransferase [Bdellovibrionales bacterium RIFOXYC1_FULL_37_79]OFZ60695.1 MAG: methionine adenosyltransferase [Bdellovibrionales bacterium RIFOXYB1_FULL_37_110]OFZ62328.1 MAG: methionine adenosyltransferase [Bdellovibrionales bacterium RIFOXYD1_FULL_36_51]
MLKDYIFTSESVTEGHPDKIADQVSDGVLDAMLEQDPKSRVACETLCTTGLVVVAGEVTTKAYVDIQKVVRRTIRDIGYDHSAKGFDANSCAVMVTLDEQSPDISQGVSEGIGTFKEQGAGDQGMMFGYAINESDNFMPLSIDLSHKLCMKLTEVRKNGLLPLLRPDGKSQVSIQYENGKPSRVDAVVISSQHAEEFKLKDIEESIRESVIKKVIPANMMDKNTKIFVNPTGRFVVGGPQGDCGLTGRKIIVDTYGGHGGHGGGAFSGKDPSKVDRSAAYAARHIAKHIVAGGFAGRALVQVAYAIGVAQPVSLMVETFGTEKVDVMKINSAVREIFDMRPKAIIERLDLLRPIYQRTAAYGHFGRVSSNGFTWEKLDKLDELRSILQ